MLNEKAKDYCFTFSAVWRGGERCALQRGGGGERPGRSHSNPECRDRLTTRRFPWSPHEQRHQASAAIGHGPDRAEELKCLLYCCARCLGDVEFAGLDFGSNTALGLVNSHPGRRLAEELDPCAGEKTKALLSMLNRGGYSSGRPSAGKLHGE